MIVLHRIIDRPSGKRWESVTIINGEGLAGGPRESLGATTTIKPSFAIKGFARPHERGVLRLRREFVEERLGGLGARHGEDQGPPEGLSQSLELEFLHPIQGLYVGSTQKIWCDIIVVVHQQGGQSPELRRIKESGQ